MNDRHLKLKDAIEVVRETVADEYIESTLELRLLDKSLTADVFEVVRCKDCRFYNPYDITKVYDCEKGLLGVMQDDFCSRGERADT